MNILETMENSNPAHAVNQSELDRAFVLFCSYTCIMHNKKLNLANIFLQLLKDERYKQLFKKLCDLDTDYDCLKYFLSKDQTLHKSKYIKNYVDSEY